MDFHLNAMQDALTILENGANAAWASWAEADVRIADKNSEISFFYNPNFPDFLTHRFTSNLLALEAQLESLQIAVTDAAESINARGIVLEIHLCDIWNRV